MALGDSKNCNLQPNCISVCFLTFHIPST